jgi:homoserine kinase
VSAAFEASAPCRIDLAGGPSAVAVAIDRRAWCRVETGVCGIAVESKDTLQRVQAADIGELASASGPVALAREVLRALGVEGGVRVVTQARVPAASGLAADSALAVALVGALARALDRPLATEELQRLAGEAEARAYGRPAAPADAAAAAHGGCLAWSATGAVERVAVDPAAIEECLLLVDAPAASVPGTEGMPAVPVVRDPAGHGARVRAALGERRFDELALALAEDWDARCRVPGWATPERTRVASRLLPAGAGLRACGGGQGTVVAIVAPPGARGPGCREAVVAAAREAALRLFPARVDLLGLDVEKTA